MKVISKVVSHYSLCKSIVRSEKLIPKLKELGVEAVILADINSMSGSVDFLKECDKEKIKPIIGVTLDVVDDIFKGTLTFLAKNKLGWQSLLKLVSYSNTEHRYKDRPTISSETLLTLEESNLIVLTGGYNSLLARVVIDHEARFCQVFDEAKAFIKKGDNEWTTTSTAYILELKRIFGEDNVYLEVQKEAMPINNALNKAMRWLGKSTNTKCIPSNPVHYLDEADWMDHHLMLCVGNKIKKSQLRELRDVENYPFLCGPNFSLSNSDDGYTKEEVKNLHQLGELCETYKVFSNPRLPKFDCPDGLDEPSYLRQLCRDGWKKKIEGKISKGKIQEYADRVKEELDIVQEIDGMLGEPLISRYFLIVQDYVNAARDRGELINYGRGSVAGSIIAYLTNITDVDPIRYDLLFSRFFNKGRISKEKFSLPDCDIDFQVGKREETISYIRQKYGKELVAQVVTFGALHGKGALKEALRINDACSQGEIQDICNIIPDPAKISGELQEMKDTEGESYSILWALRNIPQKLQKWCYLDKDGGLQGELAKLFEQAIRLEGTLKTQSSHASAVVVAPDSLSSLCPMLHSKTKEDAICGFEFEFLEKMGLLKCDILGVAELDKLNETKRLIIEKNKNEKNTTR